MLAALAFISSQSPACGLCETLSINGVLANITLKLFPLLAGQLITPPDSGTEDPARRFPESTRSVPG